MTGTQAIDGLTRLLKGIAEFVAWVGAGVSGLGIILTACGFIVRHAYLASLGVPRTVCEAKATEYLITGGQFLTGLLPLAVIGLPNLLVHAWWLVLVGALFSVLAWKRAWGARLRLSVITVLYGIWLGIALSYFITARGSKFVVLTVDPYGVVAIYTTTMFLTLGYLLVELGQDQRRKQAEQLRTGLAWLPLTTLLACALIMLPYLRGTYAIEQSHPLVEPLGADRFFLDELMGPRPSNCPVYVQCPDWRLIEMGEQKIILQRVRDGSIVVLPSNKLSTFRIIVSEKHP